MNKPKTIAAIIFVMKRVYFTIIGFVILTGCEFESYREYTYSKYDGAFTWTLLTKNAEWKNRYGHAAVLYNNKLWITGGYNPGEIKADTYYEDVWSSTNGKKWELIVDDAPWLGRRGHSMVTFNDGDGEAMFIIGGFTVNEKTGHREYVNDVWKSFNGKDWIEIKENAFPSLKDTLNWFPRFAHSTVVANHGGVDYIYIIGGATMLEGVAARYAMKYFNDVWRSTDGISWEKMNNNDFGERAEAGSSVDPVSGRIFIQGGVHGVIFEPETTEEHPRIDWHWMWSSTDGENWTQENDTKGFDQGALWRSDYSLVYYQNSLWGLPGKTSSNYHYHFSNSNLYAIWRRDNDQSWHIDSYGCDIDPRHGYATLVKENKIYILGGYTSSNGQSNDVWTAEIK